MRLAVLGATSQIARDLIARASVANQAEFHMFARRPEAVNAWLRQHALPCAIHVADFRSFGDTDYDAIINFVGVGDPARIFSIGPSIVELTLRYDQLVLDYLETHPACRYVFLSSGAVYGGSFQEPVSRTSKASFALNDLAHHEWYGAAKLLAELRHRAHSDVAICDVRVFGYFSRTQNPTARFLLSDAIRCIRDDSVLQVTADDVVRDYIHPVDFANLIATLLAMPPSNVAVDCYSTSPISKFRLLETFGQEFGLRYAVAGNSTATSATGIKPHYYSLNHRAADLGYAPTRSSLEGVVEEARALLAMT